MKSKYIEVELGSKVEVIVKSAHDAEYEILMGMLFHEGHVDETDEELLRSLLKFLRSVKDQASVGDFRPSLVKRVNGIVRTYETLKAPPPQREVPPAFECIASYKDCKKEAESIAGKILCGIALTVCLGKEIVPLA